MHLSKPNTKKLYPKKEKEVITVEKKCWSAPLPVMINLLILP